MRQSHKTNVKHLKKINILGVGITNATRQEVLEYTLARLKSKEKFVIVTPNPEIIVFAKHHPDDKNLLNQAEIALADGVGVLFGGQILRKPLKERFAGTDFIEKLCEASKEQPVSMGFVGGRAKIAERAAECLKRKYPWVNIVFVSSEWGEAGFEFSTRNPSTLLRTGQESKQKKSSHNSLFIIPNSRHIDILFVAYGAPKQERWIFENLEKLPVTCAMGVGGAFDFISGAVPRAPGLVRRLGLEWLFRLIIQPWRIKRQFALVEFIFLILREKFLD